MVRAVNKAHHLDLKLLFGGSSDFTIGQNSSQGMAVLPFTHAVLEDLGGQKAFDGIALHAYRFPPATHPPNLAVADNVTGIPNASGSNGPYPGQGCGQTTTSGSNTTCPMTWPQELSAYEQEFINRGYGHEPLWLSEFGWTGSKTVPSGQNPAFYGSFTVQKQELKAAYADLLGLKFVQAAFWFNLRDYQPGLSTPDPLFFGHYGVLQYSGAPKPAGTAFKALAHANPGR